MNCRAHMAVVGIAVIRVGVDGNSAPLKGSNASIRDARIVQVLVTSRDSRPVAQHEGHRGVDALTLQSDILPKTIRVFVHRVYTKSDFIVQRLIEIPREPLVSESASLQRERVNGSEAGFLRDPIQNATSAASAKDHG